MRFLFFLCLIPLFSSSTHKYYVSTTDMFFKPEQNQLQLVVRVFTDDFIDSFIDLKMDEVTRMRMTPHPIEFEMYYSV